MARISGVDIPRDKHVHIALRYIYGIGPTSAFQICEKTRIVPGTRVRDLTEDEVARIREVIERDYKVEGPTSGDQPEHQAADRDRLLPWSASPTRSAGARAAHPHQRPDAQGPAQDGRRAQAGDGQEVAPRAPGSPGAWPCPARRFAELTEEA
jgi:hypothetical protein